ncbi:hypothetical protein CBR_g49239 [Chara braunii]|uniref:Uncharacterized protein n=1 Tax=Chara braunii TaxID=69332 RepID=A0A388M4P9_CHABU|nr:hypothetical protein CBR_g49239 [Chara braunii]|eukprot:GBG89449.1 hypothetical protein CBR_g49239 [Chara braunii]
MPEEMADGGRKLVTLDDLIDALDMRERAPNNVPKVDTFHFKGERVSDWLDLTEQALVGLSDEVKFQRVVRYVLHSHHQEVGNVVDAANGSWARFKDMMQRKYRLGDGLLTMANLEAMNKDDFSTIGAFVHEFKRKVRKVHGISEETQYAIFLGLLTGSEASELTGHRGGNKKLTWAIIDEGVEEGSLDQVEQHQVRLQRRKRKERDATASGTPGAKRIVTDVLAVLGYDNGAEVKKRGVIAPSKAPPRKEPELGRRKEVVEVPEEEEEDDDEEDERPRQEEDQRAELRAEKRGAQEEAEPSLPDSVPKRKKYVVRMKEDFDVERMVNKLLESHNDLMNLKDILASAPRLRGELKGRLSRRLVPNVHLSTVLPREVEWTEAGTRMDSKYVACRQVDLVIRNQKCTGMVDTGAEMNIIREKGARYPNPDEEKKVVDYLDGKMWMHVAEYSNGPYASPWFCFIKQNGTLRWVQDLQRLNAVTVRDAGGLPNADALSDSCAGRPIISLINLYSGYDQLPVYPPDRPVTAMHTPRGLIHMDVAPQGWTNAVAMVQRHMIRAIQTVSPHITQPYIDDLAVKGPKEKEEDEVMPGVRRFVWKHVQDIDQVLGLLEEHNLTAIGPKSKHCMREATILGFVCNESGRRPNVKKTDKILECPVPFRSITDMRSFLGTCKFWRSFMKDFAMKTEHLRKLVRQDQEWVWGEDKEEAVGRMKGEFKEGGLVLGAPNYEATEERPFVIETDAVPTALGGVLIQADTKGKERPLRFESRTLNTTQRNYFQFKKETLAVLHCLRTSRTMFLARSSS